ncbi:MAG TPA: hypothetical protein EYP21_10140, partial [Syntrophaceae bacterium]|nr:hypothetical protein [Syntrophaceae bacterium]
MKHNLNNLKNVVIVLIAALSLINVLPLAMAETNISIQDVQLAPGANTTVPIMINNITDPNGVGSATIELY